MGERTINGIPIKKVFEKLKEDIPNVIRFMDDSEGNPYLESNVMRRHFDACVPIQNYEFVVSEPEFIVHGDRACFTCIGTLTLYDDDGKKVISKSFFGGNNCIIIGSSGKARDLALDAKNAAVTVRKECIRLYGCGERQLAEAKELHRKKKAGARGNQRQQSERSNPYPNDRRENTGTFGTQGSAQMQSNTAASVKPAIGTSTFRLAYDESGKVESGSSWVSFPVFCREHKNYRTKLHVWKNKVRNLQELQNRICTGIEFECTGKFEKYNEEFRIVYAKMEG